MCVESWRGNHFQKCSKWRRRTRAMDGTDSESRPVAAAFSAFCVETLDSAAMYLVS